MEMSENACSETKGQLKGEAKGKSWRREREERGRKQLQKVEQNVQNMDDSDDKTSLEVNEGVKKALGESDNPKEWGKGWNKSKDSEESAQKFEQNSLKSVEENIESSTRETEQNVVENDEPVIDQKEVDMKLLNEYILDCQNRVETKKQLRKQNQCDSHPEESFFSKLDSNLKKNTAFVKRLRNVTESQRESLVKDFYGLNLTKYVSEAAVAIVEAKLKLSDVNCAVILSSLMHQRYSEFKSIFLENWQKNLPLKKDEKISNPSKVRVDLRFFAELISSGVFTQKEGLPILGNLLTVLTTNDKEEHKNSNIILSFCKHCGDDYVGFIPRNIRLLSEKYSFELPKHSWLPKERQKGLKTLLKDYYKSLCKHLLTDHKELQNFRAHNHRIMRSKGELSIERKEKLEAMQEAFQKLLTTTQSFSDLFDEDLPELPIDKHCDTEENDNYLDLYNRFKESSNDPDGFSIWEDDDTKSFYESLQNLKAFIPGILFKDSIQQTSQKSTEDDAEISNLEEDMSKLDLVDDMMTMVDGLEEPTTADLKDSNNVEESPDDKQKSAEADIVNALIPDVEDVEEEVETETETNTNPSVSANKILLDAFLSSLANCINRELIDKAAVEFCMNLNTKPNRKKLVRSLFLVHRTRLDLLPFYSRLVATLQPCMPEVSIDLCTMIKQDFKYHVRKKDQINIESKVKTVRFMGELVKFKMFPKSEALYCLKILLFDFSHHQIEMACNLLETCGRYLFRSPDSHQRCKVYLDQMMRKKSVMNLNSRYITMIENAFYYCNPPEVTKVTKKERPPMHLYIRKLLYSDLAKTNVEKILRQFRKFNWDDESINNYVVKCLVHSWNVRYYNIRCVANLLAGLTVYRENIAPRVIDGILEDIRVGMEINHPKFNQRRVSTVKFLGELYNYRLVESAVIFKILYSLITFGIFYDGVDSEIDPPENLFRIKLVCALLDTCGQYFNSGSSKKKLDFFVDYFQRYYWYKKSQPFYTENNPFPVTIDYLIKDTLFILRPKLKLYASYEDVCKAVINMEEEVVSKISMYIPSLKNRSEDPESPSNDNFEVEGLMPIQEAPEEDDLILEPDASQIIEVSDEEESENQSQDIHDRTASGTQDTDGVMDSSLETELDVIMPNRPKHIQCAEDEDFMTAFDKMLSDNIQHRSQEVVKFSQIDIGIPIHVRNPKKVQIQSPIDPESSSSDTFNLSESPKSTKNFVLMTKKGNKPQYKSLEVPMDSDFVQNLKNREKAEKAEKERVKRLTLDINERLEEEDYQEMLASMQRPATICNLNRERGKPKFYQHPKGAPDADAIFGSNRQKK